MAWQTQRGQHAIESPKEWPRGANKGGVRGAHGRGRHLVGARGKRPNTKRQRQLKDCSNSPWYDNL